jgi:hypothetical protein
MSSTSTERRKYIYDWPMAALTVDGIVFGFDPNDYDNPLKVLLIRRAEEPFKAHWLFLVVTSILEMMKVLRTLLGARLKKRLELALSTWSSYIPLAIPIVTLGEGLSP